MSSNFSFLLYLAFVLTLQVASASPPSQQPSVAGFVAADELKKVEQDRDVYSSAKLNGDHYVAQTAVLIRQSSRETSRLLADYSIYAKMIPYIEKSEFHPDTQLLEVWGGIFGYHLQSFLKIEDVSGTWRKFKIVAGSFTGMEGEFLLEDLGEKGTLAYLRTEQTGKPPAPQFILETGAQIVFGLTAKRMRSYVESQKGRQNTHDPGLPQPRSHL